MDDEIEVKYSTSQIIAHLNRVRAPNASIRRAGLEVIGAAGEVAHVFDGPASIEEPGCSAPACGHAGKEGLCSVYL